jgi:hypothetical protein
MKAIAHLTRIGSIFDAVRQQMADRQGKLIDYYLGFEPAHTLFSIDKALI